MTMTNDDIDLDAGSGEEYLPEAPSVPRVDKEGALSSFHEASKPDEPQIRLPSPGECTLLVGLPDPENPDERFTNAIVRELRGSDEEAISKLKMNKGVALYSAQVEDMLLRRATESIGTVDPTPAQLGDLLIGDRGVLFSQILIATYGEQKEFEEIKCPQCEQLNDFEVDIPDMLVIRPMLTPDPWADVKLRDGRVIRVRYATGKDQLAVLQANGEATDAEMNTLMLGRCIVSDSIPDRTAFARELGVVDRKALVKALTGNAPDVSFREVSVPCPQCETEIPFTFGWADLLFA